jgi:hypothetical protein
LFRVLTTRAPTTWRQNTQMCQTHTHSASQNTWGPWVSFQACCFNPLPQWWVWRPKIQNGLVTEWMVSKGLGWKTATHLSTGWEEFSKTGKCIKAYWRWREVYRRESSDGPQPDGIEVLASLCFKGPFINWKGEGGKNLGGLCRMGYGDWQVWLARSCHTTWGTLQMHFS